jgi:hypothetical protein
MGRGEWRYRTLIGKRFGRLTVLSLEESKGHGRLWRCLCTCGNTTTVNTAKLKSGNTSSCGCLKQETIHPDLTGQRFGKLTVIEPAGVRDSHARWRCLCDCGLEKVVKTGMLRDKSVRSCGCLRNVPGGASHLEPGISTRNLIIRAYKDNARYSNLCWELSVEQVSALFAGNCFYCDCPPSRTRTTLHKYGAFTYNGIDRLNNTKGYTVENTVSCCTQCNFKKHAMSYPEFYDWVMKVYNNLKSKPRELPGNNGGGL